jgi:FkbM family methyltransferase
LRETLERNHERAKNVLSLFQDDQSLAILNGYLDAVSSDDIFGKFDVENRLSTELSCQYFPKDIPGWEFGDDEVFVDGGAWDGDSVKSFYGVTEGRYSRIFAFEPDPFIHKKLLENCKDIHDIAFFQKGLYSSNMPGLFNKCQYYGSSHFIGSMPNAPTEHAIDVDLVSLDNTVSGPVTFIKMDIEGAEVEALKGARRIITTYHPKLAICMYHKMADFWEIPELIHDMTPSYNLYVRFHNGMILSNQFTETVLYAVE